MPKRWFVCPDGEQVDVKDCLTTCRMAARCAPMPYLKMAAEWRPWSGRPSVTMLGRCTRQRWLEERVDFSENPDGSAFRIIGTRAHAALENYGQQELATEEYMTLDGLSGITDLVQEDNGVRTLIDYKVVGSYSVAKMLGISVIGQRPIFDETGDPVYYVRGPKKSQQKSETIYGPVPEKADLSDYQLQPNVYKLAWEAQHLGLEIHKLAIFAIVRDGGLLMAKNRGVLRNTYMIDIPIMDEESLRASVDERKQEILEQMNSESVPPVGTAKQTWNGHYCRNYCSVRDACSEYGDNPYLRGYQGDDFGY